VQGEIFVCSAQDTYEIVLEGLDGFLIYVSLMVMWWDYLESHVVFADGGLKFLRTLVI
jgi:hypothetical protein